MLDLLGPSSFVVLVTDYENSGLLCTCQDLNLFITKAHRRSCSILQRDNLEDTNITEQMSTILDNQLEDASHDFDRINQVNISSFVVFILLLFTVRTSVIMVRSKEMLDKDPLRLLLLIIKQVIF